MIQYAKGIGIISDNDIKRISKILSVNGVWGSDTHFLCRGIGGEELHCFGQFDVSPILRHSKNQLFIRWIADDILDWALEHRIDVDVVLSVGHAAKQRKIVEEVARALRARYAFCEQTPSLRLLSNLSEGEILKHDRIILFDVTLLSGKTFSQLYGFSKRRGAEIVAAAALARGIANAAKNVEKKFDNKFYSMFQIETCSYTKENCPKCTFLEKVGQTPA